MKRVLLTGAAATLVLGACSPPAPTATSAAPTAASAPASEVATSAATTTPPPTTTTAAPKPVMKAVAMHVPIAKQTTTTTTAPPPPPAPAANDNPVVAANGQGRRGSDTTPRQVGYIQIPKIGVNIASFRASDENNGTAVTRALNNGPTFYGNPTNPGQNGNLVVAGHRTSHGAPFRNIDRLDPGDEIVTAGPDGVPHTYVVSKVFIANPNDTWILDNRDAATITLFACHPPGSVRHRIVVYGNLKA